MITLEAAKQIVKNHVSEMGDGFIVLEDPTFEGDFGWVFSYQSAAYLKSGKYTDLLAGNAPFLVERKTGKCFSLGTAYPVEFYVKNFISFNDPHKTPGPYVEMLGWEEGARKIDATKAIQTHTDLGLRDAKEAIDGCLNDEHPSLLCHTNNDARELVLELKILGFIAKQQGV